MFVGARGGSYGSYDDSLNIPASPTRGRSLNRIRPPLTQQCQVIGSPQPSPTPSRSNSREPLYRTTSLETRSRSPSPHPAPSSSQHEYYGSANLTDRSRSPSPSSSVVGSKPKRSGRRLPATPQKPSSLNLPKKGRNDHMPHVIPSPTVPHPHKSPGSINFPRLNASPSHLPHMNIPPGGYQREAGPVRPHPYSPTDKNDLNMPGSIHSSRDHIESRTGSRDHLDRNPPRFASAQIMNNGRPDMRYTDRERDNRFRDNRFEGNVGPTNIARPRGQPPASNLPNGFKPRAPGQGGHPMDIRGSNPPPPSQQQGRQSDSDDEEDWC